MAGDDASDVTKALAALGAPAMPYRSFGPAPLQPPPRPAGDSSARAGETATAPASVPAASAVEAPDQTPRDASATPQAPPESPRSDRTDPAPVPEATPSSDPIRSLPAPAVQKAPARPELPRPAPAPVPAPRPPRAAERTPQAPRPLDALPRPAPVLAPAPGIAASGRGASHPATADGAAFGPTTPSFTPPSAPPHAPKASRPAVRPGPATPGRPLAEVFRILAGSPGAVTPPEGSALPDIFRRL